MNKTTITKKLMYSKRGQVEYLLENAFRLSFLIVALLAFFLLINYYVHNQIDSRTLQAETLANRIFYSNTIMYQDPQTSRVYPGIVDVRKLTDATVGSAINYTYTRHVGVRMRVVTKPPANSRQTTLIKEAYINKQSYTNMQALIDAKQTGKSSAVQFVKTIPVTCYDPSLQPSYYYCTLLLDINIPNS